VSEPAFDLTVVGTPFLDLTLVGLERLPVAGEELLAPDLESTPGGPAMTAVAATRLGLSVALVAPIGTDLPGRELLAHLEREWVWWAGPDAARTPTTVVMPVSDGVAMATHLPHEDISAQAVADAPARALVLSLGRLALRPPGGRCYAVTGGLEVGHLGHAVPTELDGVDAVVMTLAEAATLTGEADAERAAAALASRARAAVITLGAEGALGIADGHVARAPAVEGEVVNSTGAGDLFVAAYAWADLLDLPLDERLCWASLYAGLSVRTTTPLNGAVLLHELIEEGRRRGLATPTGPS
jgi:sugar/nucleoside kinase (ribokinase family)